MPLFMKKILVTGAAGYIGSVLCPLLIRAGYTVTALDLPERVKDFQTSGMVGGDVRDASLMKRLVKDADILIPLAGLVGAQICDEEPETAKSTNLEAIRLLNRIRSRSQWVLYPMTNSIYHPRQEQSVVDESCPTRAVSLYAQTKLQAEEDLLNKGAAVSLRFASVFGVSPSMRWGLLLNHFVYLAKMQGHICLFEKDFKRNFLHVADAATCFIHLLKGETGLTEIFNVGSANFTKAELVRKIQEYFPDLRVEPFSGASDPDQRNFFITCDKIRSRGFLPQRTVDEGIRDLIEESAKLVRAETLAAGLPDR